MHGVTPMQIWRNFSIINTFLAQYSISNLVSWENMRWWFSWGGCCELLKLLEKSNNKAPPLNLTGFIQISGLLKSYELPLDCVDVSTSKG